MVMLSVLDVQRGLRAAGYPVMVNGREDRVPAIEQAFGYMGIRGRTSYYLVRYAKRQGVDGSFRRLRDGRFEVGNDLGVRLLTEPALSDLQWLER